MKLIAARVTAAAARAAHRSSRHDRGASRALVIKYQDGQFGAILATWGKKALYYWNVEKRAGGKVRCTGACAPSRCSATTSTAGSSSARANRR